MGLAEIPGPFEKMALDLIQDGGKILQELRPWNGGFLSGLVITPSERPYSRSYLYRKSPAFDRTLAFDVELESPPGVRH